MRRGLVRVRGAGGTVSEQDETRSGQPDEPAVEGLVRGGRLGAYGALLRNRNYRLWFIAAFASGLGDWTGLVALQVLVTQLSERGSRLALFALGGIMMARLLPSLLVGPVAGVLADRYDRKRLMVVTNVVRGSLFVAIAFSTDLVALFALTFVVECFSLLFLSAKDASLPVIVRKDHLTQANQMNLLVTYGTLPVGALSATAMIAVAALLRNLGLTGANATVLALLANACTFFVAAALISRIRMPAHGRRATSADKPGVVEDLKEGLRFIQELPLIRSLILGVVGVFFGGGVVIALGPAFVGTSLGGADTDWFTLMASVGVGLVAGIIAVGPVVKRFPKEKAFPVLLTVTGAVATVMATLQSLTVTLAVGFVLGAAAGLSFVMGYTLLHEHTDDEVRARTFAAFYTGTRISMFVALGLAPFLAGIIGTGQLILGQLNVQMSGVRLVILLGGIVALLSAITAGRGMFRALAEDEPRGVRLARPRPDQRAGLFIAFEGVEGAGKSTQVAALVEALRAEGHDVVVTREPGGPPVAERIRGVLLDPNSGSMSSRTEALLYAAARAEHVERVILPALEAGKVVVCDRFIDSSLAYQGYARGLGEGDVFEINRWAIGGIIPDAVVLLYLDPEEGLRRVAERARRSRPRRLRAAEEAETGDWQADQVGDRLEREGLAFHRAVAEGFLAIAKRDRRRFCIVDASGDAGTIARQVRSALHPWLPLPASRGRSDAHRGEDPGEAARA
jgi:dTMP kinase